ncbi:glycosyltransferase family 2 protein [Alphaproteobacteria bacterium KMM 3653]|uniref:Glycosyltransferase family 2 protein n=1 Tax=Harenicola maris TaxID=2841044 RepID=A0AAP2CMY6_9RHOB|nr:glycosyltransferase family 2 protein [Harenicola maris]
MPKFSIITPCYNAQSTICHTIQSLQAQTERDWELICIDDGSTDQTCDILRVAAVIDHRIHLVQNPSKGPSAARNHGVLDLAQADLIAFCDADDQWAPGKLAELAALFTDPAVDGAFGQIGFFAQTPKDATVFSTVPSVPVTIEMLLGENPVCTMSNVTLRREAFKRTGGFDTDMVHNEDLEWLIRLVGQGARLVGLPSLHTWYRTSVGGLSTDLQAMLAGRTRALQTAQRFGVRPSPRSNAIHHRYLARRALRVGARPTQALRFALRGMAASPTGFLSPPRRGALTLIASFAALVLPAALSRAIFS